jgi:hypothetical protein
VENLPRAMTPVARVFLWKTYNGRFPFIFKVYLVLEKVTPVGSGRRHCFWGNRFLEYPYLSSYDLRELFWELFLFSSVERDAIFSLSTSE